LYGGAAGGGKTEALLMWLAEGVHNPRYAAVIFRRTRPQLARADGLIAKSRTLYQTLQGEFHESTLCWRFPSGATIELGYLEYDKDVANYQGAAYTRIAFDELTQFTEYQYTYLFSRLGRTDVGIKPGMRAASNPGGLGHWWVKNRFVTQEAIEAVRALPADEPTPPGTIFWANSKRAFVPARIVDNPTLNRREYLQRLAENLDPLTRARLKDGDWSVTAEGRIRESWFRRYLLRGEMYNFHVEGKWQTIDRRSCQCFTVVDCAATSEEKARQDRGKPPSYSAIGTFHTTSDGKIVLADMRRGLWDFPELVHQVMQVKIDQRPEWIGIEEEKTGLALIQFLRPQGYNVKALSPEGKDKLTRATAFLVRMEAGGFWLPDDSLGLPWLKALKEEFLLWTGHPDETCDQIDVCAYACRECQRRGLGEVIRLDGGLMMGHLIGPLAKPWGGLRPT
jgi:predicted phage terminase large subunit-like protein